MKERCNDMQRWVENTDVLEASTAVEADAAHITFFCSCSPFFFYLFLTTVTSRPRRAADRNNHDVEIG